MSTTTVSNLFINFNGSFENELKEKLLARYTVVFFRFKVIFLFFDYRNQVSYFGLDFLSEGYSRAKLFIDYFSSTWELFKNAEMLTHAHSEIV